MEEPRPMCFCRSRSASVFLYLKVNKGIEMKNRIDAIADNFHNLQWRVEELRGALDKEADYNILEHLEPIRTAVNNLAAVLIVAEDNLEEVQRLFSSMFEVDSSISNSKIVN